MQAMLMDAIRSTTFPMVYQPNTAGQMKYWLGGHQIDFEGFSATVREYHSFKAVTKRVLMRLVKGGKQ